MWLPVKINGRPKFGLPPLLNFFFFTKSTPKRTWGHNFATVNHVETKLCKCHHKHDVPVSSDHNHIDMSKYEWITAVYTWVKFDNVCHRRNGLLFSYSNWTQQFPATDIKHVMILDYLFSEGRYATVAVLQYNHNGNDNILFSGDQKIGLFWFFVAYKVVKYNTFPRWPFWASAILNVVLKWWIYWLHWLIITKLGIRLLHNAMKVIKTFRGSATVLPKSIMQFFKSKCFCICFSLCFLLNKYALDITVNLIDVGFHDCFYFCAQAIVSPSGSSSVWDETARFLHSQVYCSWFRSSTT